MGQDWWVPLYEFAAGLTLEQAAALAVAVVAGFLLLRHWGKRLRRRVRRARRRAMRRFRQWLWRGVCYVCTFQWAHRRWTRRRPASHAPAPMEPGGPTVLYRHYDAAGRLLYVGITDAGRGGQRWHEHADDKPWFRLVARSEVSHPYPTRADALYAEALAIRDENPVHNICRPDPARVGLS